MGSIMSVRIGVKITGSKNCFFGEISGVGVDTVVEFDNSTDITVGNLNHISNLQYSVLFMSIIDAIYNQNNFLGENYMLDDKNKSCTIVAENSRNIKTGNIHSDAHQVISLKDVDNFTTEDIYHFQKDRRYVDKTFDAVEKSISMHKLPERTQERALDLSRILKKTYISKDIQGFKHNYQELTNFLSSHVTLSLFVLPVFQNLMSSLLSVNIIT